MKYSTNPKKYQTISISRIGPIPISLKQKYFISQKTHNNLQC